MNATQAKSAETRKRNQEAKITLYREMASANRAARLALQKLLENEKATPAQILEASRLLVELGKK